MRDLRRKRRPGAGGWLPLGFQGVGRRCRPSRRLTSWRTARSACWRREPAPGRCAPAPRRRLATTKGLRGLRVLRLSFIGVLLGVAGAAGRWDRKAADQKSKRPGCWSNPGRGGRTVPRLGVASSAHRRPGGSAIETNTACRSSPDTLARRRGTARRQGGEGQQMAHGVQVEVDRL